MKPIFIVVFVVFISIFGLLNYYIGWHGGQLLNKLIPSLNIKMYWIIFWFIALSYILSRLTRGFLPYVLNNALTIIGSYWLAIMFYSVLVLLIVDIIRLIDKWTNFIPKNIKNNSNFMQIIGITIVLIIFGIVIYGAINAMNTKIVKYNIDIPKSAGNLKSLHIVALSDVHVGTIIDEKRMREAVKIINSLNPDVVLFAGDTIDEDINVFKERDMVGVFNGIKSKYGTFAILGNHEYISGHTDEAIDYIEKSGIKVLRDKYEKINDSFYLIGRDDISAQRRLEGKRKNLSELMSGINNSLPIILLDHQPSNLSEPEQNGIDLQLSGHTHKGQMFPNHFITRAIFENDWGYLKRGNLQVIVSSGFGTWGPPIKVGSNSEILDIIVNFK